MLFLHWVGNRFLSLVTNVLYNTTLSDMETCYKLFDRRVLDGITLRVRPLRLRARGHGQDPAARHPHLRGADLVHRPRVRRGQEDHLARRLRRALDPRQVPLRATSTGRATPSRATWAAVVVNYESGPLLLDCVRSLLADTSAGAARGRRRRQRLARRLGRTARGGVPDVAVVDPGANLGYARAANRGIAATHARPSSRSCNPDLVVRAGHGRGGARRASTPSPISRPSARAREPRRLAVPVGPRATPSTRRRRRPRAARAASGRATRFTRGTASSTPTRAGPATSTGCRARRCGCAGPRSTRSAGGTSGTSCTSRTSTLLAARAGSAGGSAYEPGGAVTHVQGASTRAHPYRMIVEHHRSRVPLRAGAGAGARRLLLLARGRVPRACAPLVDMAGARRCGRDPRPPQGQRVTSTSPCPSPGPATERAARRSRYRKPKRARAGRSAGTSPSRSSSSSASSPSVLVARRRRQRRQRRRPAPATRPPNAAGDHWHTALGVNICGEWLPPAPVREAVRQPEPQVRRRHPLPRRRPHPHHPFVVAEGATTRRSASSSTTAAELRRRPDSRRVRRRQTVAEPDARATWTNGDTCRVGEYKGKKVSSPGRSTARRRPATRPTTSPKDGETSPIYFLPKGAEHAVPAGACTSFAETAPTPTRDAQHDLDRRTTTDDRRTARTRGDRTATSTP